MAVFEDGLPFVPFGSRNLRLQTPNLRGTDVKVLQDIYDTMLNIMNPPQGPMGPPIAIDGIFGPETQGAVRNVQSFFGLSVDGIAGPQTYLVFGQATGSLVTYGGPVFGSRNLAQGSQGGDVTVLENRLNCFRYSSQIGGPADGFYGMGTSGAVVEFQVDANQNGDVGVPLSGSVGFETFDALWIYTYAGGRNLLLGDRGFDVAWLQLFLSTKTSSLNRPYFQGPVQGFFGSTLQAAVRQWQTDNLLPVTGVIDPLFYFSVGFNNPNRAPFPAPLPPEPPAFVSPCCVVLSAVGPMPPLSVDTIGAALLGSLVGGGQGLTVTAVRLPAPSAFGNFNSYEALAETPDIGGFGFQLHPTPETPPTWAGSVTVGLPAFTLQTTVTVRPINTATGTEGVVVLRGTLMGCQGSPSADRSPV